MLWQKESSESGFYVDHSTNIQSTDNYRLNPKKNNVIAVQARMMGNRKFLQKDYKGAMVMYNQSIRYAENESENLCLAYGNRSSCFFTYSCTIDVWCISNWLKGLIIPNI